MIPINEGQATMKRIDALLRERGISAAEFARRLGVLSAHVSNWRRRGIPTDRLPRVADVLGVSVDTVLGRVENKPENGVAMLLTGHIPVVGKAQLGDDNAFCECSWYDEPDGEIPLPSRDPMAYALKCEGASMMPRIQPGEYVVAEPSVEAQPGDEVVVQDTNKRAMVKRLLYCRDGYVHLKSINNKADDVVISYDDIVAIHPVLAIIPKKLWNPPS